MKSHVLFAFAALTIGAALGSVHGCGADPASAGTGGAGGATQTSSGTCPPVECVTPGPTLITSYADLFTTLKSGARARVVFDYAKCKLAGAAGPAAIGAMNLDTFEWFDAGVNGNPKPYIAASDTKLISFPPGHVYDYVKVRVYEDGKVQVGVQYLDPVTFTVSVDETINCGFNDGTTDLGASFYKLSPELTCSDQ